MAETAINLEPEVESKALAIPGQAKFIFVTDNDSMEQANTFKLDIKQMIKEIDDWFKPLADKAFQTHRAITGKWNETKKPLQDADAHVTQQVKLYLAEVRRKQEAEEARLREIARKEEEERRLAEAAELEAEGRTEEAEEILAEPITYVAPVPVIDTPRIDRRMYSVKKKARVMDKMAVIRTVASNPALQDLIDINMTVANQKAKALGKALNTMVKGLEYYEE